MRKTLYTLAVFLLLTVAGCGTLGVGSFAPGLTTEAEVRAKLGAPGMSWTEPDGGKLLEYSGQPSGTFCHMILIGPDGKVREIRNAFTDENFSRVVPGLTQDAVRRLLGKPEEVVRFHLKPDEEVWSWLTESTAEKDVFFNAYFSRDGRVLRSERLVVWKASGPSFN
ncbi:MAG: outer membrane protein assembly factor BamE [Burkholderiales bacterium]|nr:outer membrane protein assembly factor BamE [Burkholderiales bacterium]MCZ2419339.1 outer membrane protein assembly factor BamE [Burkholderiales bacterium]